MTQQSRPQADNQSNGYDDAGPYSRNQWAERLYAVYTGDENTALQRLRTRGVVPTFDNMLVVTTAAGDITVGTGAGFAGGTFLFNSATVTFSPTHAARTDYVVIVENNTNAAYNTNLQFPTDLTDYEAAASVPPYTARLAILDANVGIGGLVQSTNYWMVPLASYDIDGAGAVTNLTDLRQFIDVETVVSAVAAENDDIHDAAILGVEVNDGVGAAGLGVAIKFRLEDGAGVAADAGQIAVRYTDATTTTEETRFELRLQANGSDNLAAVINAPDASSVDGNARGAGAVDLQQRRGAAGQVASGAYAFLAGYNSTASGAYATSIGQNNTASGDYAVALGRGLVASGAEGSAEGYSATASGDVSHAEGYDTEASGDYAHSQGYQTLASADYSSAAGKYAVADHYAQDARASAAFSAEGDAQTSVLTASRYIASHDPAGTYFELYIDGATAALLTIPGSSAWAVEVLVIGMTANAAQHWGYQVLGTIARDAAGNTAIGTTTTTAIHESDAAYNAMLVADDVNEALLVSVGRPGIGADYAIRWVAKIRLTQVKFAA